jgi:ribosomal protein L30E
VELIKEIIVGSKCPPIVKHKAAKFGLLQGIPVYSMILGNDHFGARRELIGDFER